MALVASTSKLSSSSSSSSASTPAYHDVIGHATNLLDRLCWINVGNDAAPKFWKKEESPLCDSVSKMVWWWPGIVYDGGLSELVRDIDPKARRLLAELTLQQNRQRAAASKRKSTMAVALLLGFDNPVFRPMKDPVADLTTTRDGGAAAEYFFVHGKPPLPPSSMGSCSFYSYHDAIQEEYSQKVSHPELQQALQKAIAIAMTLVERCLQRQQQQDVSACFRLVFLDDDDDDLAHDAEQEDDTANHHHRNRRVVSPGVVAADSSVARAADAPTMVPVPTTLQQRKKVPTSEPDSKVGKRRPSSSTSDCQGDDDEEVGTESANSPSHNDDDDAHDENESRTADTPIRNDDEFIIVWEKLRHRGWYWKPGKGTYSYFYYKPDTADKNFHSLCPNKDYFRTQEELMDHIRQEYGWKRDFKPNPQPRRRRPLADRTTNVEATKRKANEEHPTTTKRPKKKKPPRLPDVTTKDESSSSDEDEGAADDEEEEEKEAEEEEGMTAASPDAVNSAAVSSPVSSISSANSNSTEGSEFWRTFPLVWKRLKEIGWKVKKPSGLDSWQYLRPHCPIDLDGMVAGKDYFRSEVAVLDYIQTSRKEAETAQDDCGQPFEQFLAQRDGSVWRAFDAEAVADTRLQAEVETISNRESGSPKKTKGAQCALPATPPAKATPRPKRKRVATTEESPSPVHQQPAVDRRQRRQKWWQQEGVPTFGEVSPILRKLGISKDKEGHRVPGEEHVFPSEDCLRRYLCRTGIPRVEGKSLGQDDLILVTRWVSTAFLPRDKKLLKASTELSSLEASKLLKSLGYSELDGRFYAPGCGHLSHMRLTNNKDYFRDLEALRFFLRCHGLRHLEEDVPMTRTKRQTMELLLWASLMPVSPFRTAEDDASLSSSTASAAERPKRQSARMHHGRTTHEYCNFEEFQEPELAKAPKSPPPKSQDTKMSLKSPEKTHARGDAIASPNRAMQVDEILDEGREVLDLNDVAVLTQPGET